MTTKFVSNVRLTNYFQDRVIVEPISSIIGETHRFKFLKLLSSIVCKYDGLLVLNPSFYWAWLGMNIKILSFCRKKIVFYDTNLHRPYSYIDFLKAYIKKFVFKFIDRFIVMHKDTSEYLRYYGIPIHKCIYVPFKANNIDKLSKYNITDKGYLLSCGASYRDYVLLASALKLYSCRVTIVLPDAQMAGYHNSIIDETMFGDNVTIIRHDFKPNSWYKVLSECRAVVLPIRSDALQPAGISVYLESMAFGKPVVITEGPSTSGILTEELAAICPPDDPYSLSKAIKKVMEDEVYRMNLSRNGNEYAKSLGGEDRLVKDILNVLVSLYE